jgi:hypothetical protein
MNNYEFNQSGPNVPAVSGSMPVVAVGAGEAHDRLFIMGVIGRRGRIGLRGKVEGAALTAMRLLRGMRAGAIADGDFTIVAEDADFATLAGTVEIQNVMPANPHETAAGNAFDLILNCDGVAEYALEVRAAGDGTVSVDYVVT